MGVTYADGILTGPSAQQAAVRFLVDSGATYTLVPHDVWRALGLGPKRTVTFSTAAATRENDKTASFACVKLLMGHHTLV
jgi:predicted aspartyl protease